MSDNRKLLRNSLTIAVNGTALAVPHSYITHKPKEGQIEKAIPSL